MITLAATSKQFALSLGFGPVGITSADEFPAAEAAILARLESGLLGGLPWLTADRTRLGCRPRARFPWARSIIALAMAYPPANAADWASAHPERVARYARGEDYHSVIGRKLRALAVFLAEQGASQSKAYVDTGPLPERAVAVRAGMGWFGKNTNVLTTQHGSWVFIAAIITDLDLTPDEPLRKSCGACTACLDACPTGALVAPYVLDTQRCISYLTIELRDAVAPHLRPKIGDLVFGCDICQCVCPVNLAVARRASAATHLAAGAVQATLQPDVGRRHVPAASTDLADLAALLRLDDAGFHELFSSSAIRRAKRLGLQRNVAIALGNSRNALAVPALSYALAHTDPLVRRHAAWALGHLGGASAVASLRAARASETEVEVREEIQFAIEKNHLDNPPLDNRQPIL